jgi:hypothetical protein
MTTSSLPTTYEARLRALEKAFNDRAGTVGGGVNGNVGALQFTPGGSLIIPGGSYVGQGGFRLQGVPSPPTGLILTTGSSPGDIYIDAGWSPPVYSVDVIDTWNISILQAGNVTPELIQVPADRLTDPYRIHGRLPNTTYTIRVWGTTVLGASSDELGPQDITTGIDDTQPAKVTGLSAFPGYKTITATWNDLGGSPPNEFKGTYEIQAATNSSMTTGTLSQNVGNAKVATLGALVTGTDYWIRVRAISTSEVAGPYSDILGPITPGQAQGSFTSDGVPPATTTSAPTATSGVGIIWVAWTPLPMKFMLERHLGLLRAVALYLVKSRMDEDSQPRSFQILVFL